MFFKFIFLLICILSQINALTNQNMNENEINYNIDWRYLFNNKDIKKDNYISNSLIVSINEIEAFYKIKYDNELNISIQQVLDCYYNNGCKNINIYDILNKLINSKLCSNNEYPYTGKIDQCKENCVGNNYIFEKIEKISKNIEKIEKKLTKQPIIIELSCEINEYTNGIYNKECNGEITPYLLVGSGKENDNEFWLLKSNDGNEFGENGYIRIEKNNKYIHSAYSIKMSVGNNRKTGAIISISIFVPLVLLIIIGICIYSYYYKCVNPCASKEEINLSREFTKQINQPILTNQTIA